MSRFLTHIIKMNSVNFLSINLKKKNNFKLKLQSSLFANIQKSRANLVKW